MSRPAEAGITLTRWREDVVNKDKDGLLRLQLNPLANDKHELADSEVGRHQIPAAGRTNHAEIGKNP